MGAKGIVPPWVAQHEATRVHIDVEGERFVALVGSRDEDAVGESGPDWIRLEDGWVLRGRWGFEVAMEAKDHLNDGLEKPGLNEEAYPRRQREFGGWQRTSTIELF
jgi:hypothetical protein